ncbi:HAMP domain-containing histidine kinase [Clavibacter michiganensis subsp. phaseoli]|uniref:sensor histidine kinase n=1 Tax=Clavibacter phaseoli TaxID=1734031 RepID=UPI001FB23C66|nr:HAMP domain-containing sensor histidine kinase [Clavibacter phaseoli]MCJ1710102.1 HAMP domain-containing histidine kinase [Clavibacter phaseoli]
MPSRGPERRSGPSVRNRLALAYTGLIVVTGIAMILAVQATVRIMNGANIAVLYQVAAGTVVVIAALGGLASWLLAGRLLRPLQELDRMAREVDETTLDTRIGMAGPRDEIRSLADTFDGMVARLEAAFASRALFAANASHELRTPLATMKTMIQVALRTERDPETRDTLEGLLRTVDAMTGTTTALLELAAAREPRRDEAVDLSARVAAALRDEADACERAGISVTADLPPVTVAGDARLLDHLVGNLVRNAVVHNVPGGWIRVRVASRAHLPGAAVLEVGNSGEVVPEDDVPLLTEPFHRVRRRTAGGHGLGLALVRAVADAHHAEVRIVPRSAGGLVVEVAFPPPTGVAPPA